MAAKPILDLMAEVETEADGLDLVPAIETLGYGFRPDEDVPGRLYFRKRFPDGRCTHHLSVVNRAWANAGIHRVEAGTCGTVQI